jgi:hypothetical protein
MHNDRTTQRGTPSARNQDIYQARISCAGQPKPDSRGQQYVRAEVTQGRLGISGLHMPCGVLRDYFYVADCRHTWDRQARLYEILRTSPSASPTELRLAFRLRQLELNAETAPKADLSALERAFNILAQPDLRACYNQLLNDPEGQVVFPYGGVGSILANGQRSRDGQTFFASRILSFRPEVQQRRFRAPLPKVDFYHDHAVYRDGRRRLEIGLDQSAMPIVWDATWNQCRHLLGAKKEGTATPLLGPPHPRRLRCGSNQLAPGLRCLLLPAPLPEGAAAVPVPRGVYLGTPDGHCCRDATTGERDICFREASEH